MNVLFWCLYFLHNYQTQPLCQSKPELLPRLIDLNLYFELWLKALKLIRSMFFVLDYNWCCSCYCGVWKS